MTKKQIVKVQLSISTNLAEQQLLVYNQNRSWLQQSEATDEIREMMAGKLKAYFYAAQCNGEIVLYEEAPTQTW